MEWSEIKDKSAAELETLLAEERAALQDLRFKVAGGALKQVHKISVLRRSSARVLTRLKQLKSVKS